MSREPIAATGRFADCLIDPLFSNASLAKAVDCVMFGLSGHVRPALGQDELSRHLARLPHLALSVTSLRRTIVSLLE
jgi:hypothetical protein